MHETWEPFGSTRLHDEPSRPTGAPRAPARRLIVVTCMDARIEPMAILGLRLGDAHVIRNAGAEATADVLRSAQISHSAAGTERVIVMGHTDCAARTSDEAAEEAVHASVAALTAALPALDVSGAMYDVATGTIRRLVAP